MKPISWLRIAVGTLVGSVGLTVGAIFFWLYTLGVLTVSESQLTLITNLPQSDNTVVFDRNQKKIGEFFSQYHRFVGFDDFPPHLVQAIISVEDRNFWHHKGYDPRGMLRALWASLKSGGYSQGASTLTQQLVRNFLLGTEKSMNRKVQELALAYQLEKRLSKRRIFELYANRLFLGNGAYGVGAAAERYFGRPIKELNLAELALIAGLFQSPSAYNPHRFPKRAIARQQTVLDAMVSAGYLEPDLATQASLYPLKFQVYQPLNAQIAPYFVDHIAQEVKALLESKKRVQGQGLRIFTTLDTQLQQAAERAIAAAPKLWQASAAERRKGAPV